MNEIDYRDSLIKNIHILNELIIKVDNKNKINSYILIIIGVSILIFLMILCFIVYKYNRKHQQDYKEY